MSQLVPMPMPLKSTPRPVILSQGHVSRALADAAFYQKLPEFRPLQSKLQAMHVDLASNRGCSSCKRRRASVNLFADFLAITRSLPQESVNALKAYLGVEILLINTNTNGHVETKAL